VDQQIIIFVVFIALMGGLMFWQKRQGRSRREKQLAELTVGEKVVTIGGIIGRLTHLDSEEKRARIEIAPGVEMQVMLAAISRPLASS